jgi:hypothetical protein
VEAERERWEDGLAGHHSWADSDFEADLAARNGACAVVHAHRRCEVVLEYWRIAE